VFLLKDVLRYELKSEIRRNNIREDLLQFESRIDRLAMFAFDMYERCREEIYEIRVNEIKGRMSRLLEKTNKRLGISIQGPDIVNENTDGIV
jgi:putative component of toxin-antitoxin plasmid stabilization module